MTACSEAAAVNSCIGVRPDHLGTAIGEPNHLSSLLDRHIVASDNAATGENAFRYGRCSPGDSPDRGCRNAMPLERKSRRSPCPGASPTPGMDGHTFRRCSVKPVTGNAKRACAELTSEVSDFRLPQMSGFRLPLTDRRQVHVWHALSSSCVWSGRISESGLQPGREIVFPGPKPDVAAMSRS